MDLSALLDELSSTRSSISQRVCALQAIEQLLATLCGPRGSQSTFHAFIILQDRFESNIVSRLITVLASWLLILRESLESAKYSKPSEPITRPAMLQPIMQAMSILQGLALLHEPSKAFLGRRWCIQLCLDFISVSKHIPDALDASTSKPLTEDGLQPPTSNLTNSVLDTLLCILVDNPGATRSFEDVGGLDIIVRTLKRQGVSQDVRMKCLEFLYFYLLPEDDGTTRVGQRGSPDSQPNTASDGSPPMKPAQTAISTPSIALPCLSLSTSSDVPFDADETFAPNPKVAELRMLRRDIDFVPVTPTKSAQIANLGIGSPFIAREPSTPSKTSTKRRRQENNSGISPSPSRSSLDDLASPLEPRTPRREHVRGRSDITLVDGGRHSVESDRSSHESVPSTPVRVSKHSPATPTHPKLKTSRRLHTRGSSMAEATLVGNPMLPDGTPISKKVRLLPEGGLLQFEGGGDRVADSNRLRSTAEKTALLSNYLGNVGALVEGMKRAGAWGLE